MLGLDKTLGSSNTVSGDYSVQYYCSAGMMANE